MQDNWWPVLFLFIWKYLCLLWKAILCRYEIIGSHVFLFSILKISFQCLLFSIVSIKWSCVNLIITPLKVTFFLVAFKMFSWLWFSAVLSVYIWFSCFFYSTFEPVASYSSDFKTSKPLSLQILSCFSLLFLFRTTIACMIVLFLCQFYFVRLGF